MLTVALLVLSQRCERQSDREDVPRGAFQFEMIESSAAAAIVAKAIQIFHANGNIMPEQVLAHDKKLILHRRLVPSSCFLDTVSNNLNRMLFFQARTFLLTRTISMKNYIALRAREEEERPSKEKRKL